MLRYFLSIEGRGDLKDSKIVWSCEDGDLRKKNQDSKAKKGEVDEAKLTLHLRRLTSGKGRTVVEITQLPIDKSWCKKLAKELKKSLGVGGAYKSDFIEIHGEKMDEVKQHLDEKNIRYQQVGG